MFSGVGFASAIAAASSAALAASIAACAASLAAVTRSETIFKLKLMILSVLNSSAAAEPSSKTAASSELAKVLSEVSS